MVKLYLQDYGTVYKLFIVSDIKQEIEFEYNGLFNWQGTSGSLAESSGDIDGKLTFFVWTNKEKLLKCFYNRIENVYCQKFDREPDGNLFKQELLKQSQKKLSLIERIRTPESTKSKIYGELAYHTVLINSLNGFSPTTIKPKNSNLQLTKLDNLSFSAII